MRFTISREKLQEGLTAVASTVPAKTTLPVLANILLETTDKGIRVSGTDLDIAVSTEVSADGCDRAPKKRRGEPQPAHVQSALAVCGFTAAASASPPWPWYCFSAMRADLPRRPRR